MEKQDSRVLIHWEGILGTSSLNTKPAQRGGTTKSIVALVNQKGNRPE